MNKNKIEISPIINIKNKLKSFSEIIDILDKGSDHIDKDLLIKIVEIFEDNVDKNEKALANLIISELEKYPGVHND